MDLNAMAALLCSALLCSAMLCYAMLCFALLCCCSQELAGGCEEALVQRVNKNVPFVPLYTKNDHHFSKTGSGQTNIERESREK